MTHEWVPGQAGMNGAGAPGAWGPGNVQQHQQSAPQQPGRGNNKALLWILVAVLVIAVGAVAFWFFVIRPAPVVSSSKNVVRDIRTAPEKAWTHQFAARGDEEWITMWPTVLDLGFNRMAVLAALDSEHWDSVTDSEWYEGYDEDYATGYADGARRLEAFEIYHNDDSWGVAYPEISDYFSLDGVSYDDLDYGNHQGWLDGSSDAEEELAEGANQAVRPDPPPTMGSVAVVDMDSGDEVWSVELESLGVDSPYLGMSLVGPSPEGHLVLVASSYEGDGSVTIHSLSPVDGSVVSSVELDGYVDVADGGGLETPVVVASEGNIRRLNSADLDGTPVWSANIDGAEDSDTLWMEGDHVAISTEDGNWWLDAATGSEPPWFPQADWKFSYLILEDVVIRLEDSSFGYYIDALGKDGEVLWSSDAETLLIGSGSGGEVVLRAETIEDGGYEYLMRLDPRTGEEMWDREYDGTVNDIEGTVPGAVLLRADDRTELIDLVSGDRQLRLRGTSNYLGTTVVHGSDEGRLRAWDVSDGAELWAMRLTDSEELVRVGDALLIRDTGRRTLSLLKE